MALHLHLQNLPRMAVNLDIRRFFIDFDIPPGGVQIVGGDAGNAFITFKDQQDLLSSMSQNQKTLLGNKVNLRIVDTSEMDLVIEKRCLELKSMRMSPSESEPQHQASLQQPESAVSQSDTSSQLKRKLCGIPPWLREVLDDESEVEVKRRRACDSDNGFDRSRYSIDRQEQQKDIHNTPRYSPEHQAVNIEQSRERSKPPWTVSEDNRDTGMSTERRQPPWTDLMERREASPSTVRREPPWIDTGFERASDEHKMRREPPWIEQEDRDTSLQRGGRGPSWSDPDMGRFGQGEPRVGMEANVPQASPYPQEGIREERWLNWGSNMDTWDTGNYMMSDQVFDYNHRKPDYDQGSHTTPGFIRMSNVAKSVTYRNIRQFFTGYMIEKGGIILKPDNHNPDSVVACIQFVHLNDALVFENRQGMMQGNEVVTKLISSREYENFSKTNEHPSFATPGYAMIPNLPPSVRYRDVKEYLREYNVVRVIIKPGKEANDLNAAFIHFKNLEDALRCDGMKAFIHGKTVKIDIISHSVYENRKVDDQNDVFSMKMSKKSKVDELQTKDIDQGKQFLAFSGLPSDMTAWNLWQKLGGSRGPCKGVILASLQTESGAVTEMAFGVYDNSQSRNVEKAKHANVKPLNEKGLYRRLMNFHLGFKIFKASPSGKNEVVSQEKIDELRQSFFPNGEQGQPLTDSQMEYRNLAVKSFSKYLFSDRPVVEGMKKINKSTAPTLHSRMYFLGLGGLPENATACELWGKFGGSNGPCKGVILLSLQENGSTVVKFAYGAYDNFEERNAEKKKHENGISMKEKGLYYKVMSYDKKFDVTIFRSSPSGKDEVLSNEGVRQKIFQQPEEGVPLTKAQLEERQLAVIEVIKYLFGGLGGQASEGPKESKVQPLEDSKESLGKVSSAVKETTSVSPSKSPIEYVLRLTELPWNVTACEIWNWFDGPQGSSTGVSLVRKSNEGTDSAVLANVTFKDIVSRRQAKAEHPQATPYSVRATNRHLALFGPQFDIFLSTCEGTDHLMTKEERLAFRQKYLPNQAVVGETTDQDKIGAVLPPVKIEGNNQKQVRKRGRKRPKKKTNIDQDDKVAQNI